MNNTKIRRRFVDTEHGQMHCRIAGSPSKNETLICLHQSPRSSREFIPFIEHISTKRQVIAVDNPGHGESYVPDYPVGIEGYARAVWATLDGLGADKVDLVGYHTGSEVAAEMTWQRPERVNHIVMISALIATDQEREKFIAEFQPVPLDEEGSRFKRIWQKSIYYRGPNVTLEILAASLAESVRAGHAYEWGHQAAFEYSRVFPERLQSLFHPVTGCCQSNANPSPAAFGVGGLIQPQAGAIRRGRCFSSI
jgi:pimeloyl-ACP methyl ester carboxylesterase